MTIAVLSNPWLELMPPAAARAISPEARRSGRDLRLGLDLAPSVSVDEVYQESVAALFRAYKEASCPDWDGYGAEPVAAATFAQALAFLSLVPSAVPRPEVMAHPDGELAFEWSLGPRRLLTVSVSSSGQLSYAAIIGHTRQHGTEFLLDSLPEPIALVLRRLHSAA